MSSKNSSSNKSKKKRGLNKGLDFLLGDVLQGLEESKENSTEKTDKSDKVENKNFLDEYADVVNKDSRNSLEKAKNSNQKFGKVRKREKADGSSENFAKKLFEEKNIEKELAKNKDDDLEEKDKEFFYSEDNLHFWSIERLEPSRFQPRKDILETDLISLSESIKSQGVLQPLVVRKTKNGRAEIIAGERRWRASKIAGLKKVPVIVKDISDRACMAVALIENVQREDLNPIEGAMAIERLVNEFDLTHAKIAKAIGKSRTSITNLLRLLTLQKDVKSLLERGDIEVGHAKVLLGLPMSHQAIAARNIVAKNLSVRETETFIARLLNNENKSKDKNKFSSRIIDPDIKLLEKNISEKINAKVNILHNRKGRGKLIIHYGSLDELDGILSKVK